MTRFHIITRLLFLSLLGCGSIIVQAQTIDRAHLESEMSSLRERIKEIEKQFLSPAAEDHEAFENFLRQPETGLIRLLPREKFERLLAIRGGGAYYSFTRRTHEYGYGSDIELQQGGLSVGFAGADFGMITTLEDATLDSITLEHAAVEYLSSFSAPTKESEARAQARATGVGFAVNGFTYRNHVPASVNKTYVLRSINYEQADVLAAFRVVRRDVDGSVIIAWKILKRFPVPHLERTARARSRAGN